MRNVLLVTLAACVLVTTNCKRVAPSAASSEDSAASNCSCDDLGCWERATNKGIHDNLSCVKNAATGIGAALGPGLVAFGVGAYDVGSAVADTEVLDFFNSVAGESDAASKWLGDSRFTCVRSSASIFGDVLSVANVLRGIREYSDYDKVYETVRINLTVFNSSLRLNDVATNCSAAFAQKSDNISHQFNKITGGLKKIGIGLAAFNAFASCGYAFATGGKVLLENTACLADDIQVLLEQKDKLDRLHDNNMNEDAPNGSDDGRNGGKPHCNGESLNCSSFAMGKYGSWLRSQSLVISGRAKYCANSCGNGSKGTATCNEASAKIFANDPACGKVCDNAQCNNAIDVCVSYCCDQEGSCVSDAHAYLGY
jgi:hypothetical protein